MPNWWDYNISEEQMLEWVGDYNAKTKKIAREHVKSQGYKNILDCGAGLCSEYDGYKSDGYDIDYHAIDTCDKFVDMASKRGINIKHGPMGNMDYDDASFDVVYIRHVLEHLNDAYNAMSESVRIAKKEVLIIFFIKPHDTYEIKRMGHGIPHNIYSKQEIERRLDTFLRVDHISWEEVDKNEIILHIWIKKEE